MIDLIIPALLAIAMCITMVTDATKYIIPNWVVLSVIMLYPIWVFIAPAPVDWTMGLAMAGGLLLLGFGLFALGILGAGDAKLLAALGLFTGWSMAGLEFILNMALIGGGLAIILVTLRKMYKYK
jgi:prepilin peptidase CpaA